MSYPQLNKKLLLSSKYQNQKEISVPTKEIFELPEKILQFGAGRFLRAFTDYYIDTANKQNVFNGRIVIVKSTGGKESEIIENQDGLYTLCIQGLKNGKAVEKYNVLSSISRALSAKDQWSEILECAHNPEMEIIISNTTEIGITFDENDSIDLNPPKSFPGKLTAFLFERYKTFRKKGFIIIPCELIDNNGDELKKIVIKLANKWNLEKDFIKWLNEKNTFCNTLVDRIVPGIPGEDVLRKIEDKLGFKDELLLTTETYSLWAIEGDDSLKDKLEFTKVNPEIIIDKNVNPYRERKLRILNGTHTFAVQVSYFCGKNNVLESVSDDLTYNFIRTIMFDGVVPSLDVDRDSAINFAEEVLTRFKNPFLDHHLLDITFQITKKMNMRNVPTIKRFYKKLDKIPYHFCFGFAAYILFMKSEKVDGKFYGKRENEKYLINDDQAEYFFNEWNSVDISNENDIRKLVDKVCSNMEFWDSDLNQLNGFADTVSEYLNEFLKIGVKNSLVNFFELMGKNN